MNRTPKKPTRRKDWNYELSLAFAAPGSQSEKNFFENNTRSHLEPMGIFLYAAAIYPKKCLDFFVCNSCALHRDRPNFSRWCLLESRCPFAISRFDYRSRTGEIFSV